MTLLVGQVQYLSSRRESYPSLTMPAFAGAGGYRNGVISISDLKAAFLTGNRERVCSSAELLAEFPTGHRAAVSWTLRPLDDHSRRRRTPAFQARLGEWLAARGRALFPGEVIQKVELRWYRGRSWLESGQLRQELTLSGTFAVPLPGR
jgi:hypothetical protein